MNSHSLLLLPGDGIGPEAMAEVQKALRTTQAKAKKPPKDYRVAINVDAVGVF